jgi:hypothetical protein
MLLIQQNDTVSPARLLEMLSDRFGAFEAIAYSTIKLASHVSEDELAMDRLVAQAILEFADDLRAAMTHADTWRELPEDSRSKPS